MSNDATKTFERYQKAADQGDAHAQSNLGLYYKRGQGVAKNLSKAVEWYQKAANQGFGFAREQLAAVRKEIKKSEGRKRALPTDDRAEIVRLCAVFAFDHLSPFHLPPVWNARGLSQPREAKWLARRPKHWL